MGLELVHPYLDCWELGSTGTARSDRAPDARMAVQARAKFFYQKGRRFVRAKELEANAAAADPLLKEWARLEDNPGEAGTVGEAPVATRRITGMWTDIRF
ncbi:hypothetical protein BESB_037580 [Besnoitia besnoiti]|uniref:Uncharacterized protein n=1 Tax=Besnoitia besnoiti TaxID=94643 RepID=A0A2A9MNL3_BESBE|nr:hypothetical protein BESB_037580 [Besnoitia besnoiti]PFH37300.1 hypothetical protein BESB_037580 [Besnoitia besnoiti]